MKVLLISIGTRGDIEPFLAIGELLKEKGHEVVCAFPEQFRKLAEDSELGFFSLGKEFIEMVDSDTVKAVFGNRRSGLAKVIDYIKLARNSTGINKELVRKQYRLVEKENPDRILYNGKAIYPILWGLENKNKNILISPVPFMHYVKGHTHVGFHSNFGPILNKLTYSLADFGLITTAKISANWLNLKKKTPRKQIKKAVASNRAIYTISPALFPRPDYWPENLRVLGYHERDKTVNWQVDKNLEEFIGTHQKILFVTFGSMTNTEPEVKTKTILEILEQHRIPAIINTAFGGLVEPAEYNSNLFYFVPEIPYDYVFPKMYGVIHHGGSGTTHMALKYGCASMIIPHIIDQHSWNTIVSDLGAGPKGMAINKITRHNLEPKILDLFNNQAYKTRAMEIAAEMKQENLREQLYEAIIK